MSDRPAHQERVIVERDELATKTNALQYFIEHNPIFPKLPLEERKDLRRQLIFMELYLEVLDRRITRF